MHAVKVTALGLVLGVLAGGCTHIATTNQVVSALEREYPSFELQEQEHISMGRITLGMVRMVLRLVPDEEEVDEALRILEHLDRLEVATFRFVTPRARQVRASSPLDRRLQAEGWTAVVSSSDDGEQTWLYVRQDERSVRGMIVVSLDGDELEVVSLEGDLDEVVAAAMAGEELGITRIVENG